MKVTQIPAPIPDPSGRNIPGAARELPDTDFTKRTTPRIAPGAAGCAVSIARPHPTPHTDDQPIADFVT